MRQTLRQMLLLETQLGPDRTLLHMRAALEAHLAQAAEACWKHVDAADRMVAIEIEAEDARARTPWRRSSYGQLLAQARAEYRDRALAARGSADAALGVAQAIAAYVRSLSEVQRLSDPAPLVSRVLSALFPNGQDCLPIISHSGILICA